MCGLVAWVSPGGEVDGGVLAAMDRRIAHRGPDGEGRWVSSERGVGLAHRRLSIVDLDASADQPMHGPAGCVLVFNGEIYGHRELRAELERAGARFRTSHSDTEVLLHGYLHWGIDGLLERLDGMFAFALWDPRVGKLYVARDRIGIKPLYVARVGQDLLFASEAKALFAHPGLEPRLDPENFRHHLSFRALPPPLTLFQDVQSVGAGELCEVDRASGSLVRRTWWDPLERASEAPPTREAAAERLEELLVDSVQRRLQADVPVGVLLSGGVDSSLLLELAREQRGELDAWTVSWPGNPEYDELEDAAERARAAGARHHPVPIDAESYAEALADVAWHQDEPIAAPVCTAVWFLARAARTRRTPVVLAGEGADELLVGYSNWIRLRDAARLDRRLPDLPGRLLRRGAAQVGRWLLPWPSPEREILRRAAAGQPLFWSGALDFGEEAKSQLLGPDFAGTSTTFEDLVAPLRRTFEQRGGGEDPTLWMSWVDLRFRLPQLMLPRLDKMGMAFGVEGRVPYLDHRIVEFVFGLPPAWRGGGQDRPKALLKEVAARRLPHDFVWRPKRGFRAPVSEWKQGPLGERYGRALERFADRTGLFRTDALRELMQRGGDRRWFSLVNLMLWYLLYVDDVLDGSLPEVVGQRSALQRAA